MRLIKEKFFHAKQIEFLKSEKYFRAYVGGRGAGKTVCGANAAAIEAGKRKCTGMCVAPTYKQLRDYVIPGLIEALGGAILSFNKSNYEMELINGSKILLRSAEDPDSLRGPSLSFVWLDESRSMPEEVWQIVIATLREDGRMGRLWTTTTPNGKQHWVYKKFVEEADDNFELIVSSSKDNPFLSEIFLQQLERDYGFGTWGQQELEGKFVDPEGSLFQRTDINITDVVPEGIDMCRSWDLAISAKTSSDWTVGAKVGITATNDVYISDVVRHQAEWPKTKKLITQTAQMDVDETKDIVIETVAFQAVAVQELHEEPKLAQYVIHKVHPDKDKLTRALPLASKSAAGKLYLKRGDWNREFLDELCSFTGNNKEVDDQVDAVTQAYLHLTSFVSDVEVLII